MEAIHKIVEALEQKGILRKTIDEKWEATYSVADMAPTLSISTADGKELKVIWENLPSEDFGEKFAYLFCFMAGITGCPYLEGVDNTDAWELGKAAAEGKAEVPFLEKI